MTAKYLITGIGAEVGKTMASGIVTEVLHADYWKPALAGCEKKKKGDGINFPAERKLLRVYFSKL